MFYNILTVDEISKCIGKDNKAVIGIKDNNIAKEIAKKLMGVKLLGKIKIHEIAKKWA